MSSVAQSEQPTVVLGPARYHVKRPWGELPAALSLGPVSQLALDSHGKVYVFQRTDPLVLVFNPDGEYAGAWGNGQTYDAHGIFISPNDRVFLVGRDAHQIVVCDPQGKVVNRLGARHQPTLGAHFNHPTDVAVAADGDIYVADGYGNSLVHWYSASGQLKRTWGGRGEIPIAPWIFMKIQAAQFL